jgi:hypothetical protein
MQVLMIAAVLGRDYEMERFSVGRNMICLILVPRVNFSIGHPDKCNPERPSSRLECGWQIMST